MKKEFKVIADLLPSNTRVLDVGCGDGSLMTLLRKEKNITIITIHCGEKIKTIHSYKDLSEKLIKHNVNRNMRYFYRTKSFNIKISIKSYNKLSYC